MKTMNFETAGWRRDAIGDETTTSETIVIVRRRRRNIIIAVLAGLALLAALAFAFLGAGKDDKAATAEQAKNAQALPRVTVIVPGRQQVAKTINATGTIAARRDMPVGIAGEGGMVARVLVDAGQWVSAGQTLAVIERSVQAQESQQLAASIEVARADARLAQQELDRAQALVGRGFVSKADVQRRTATRDAANARVKVAQAQFAASRARIGRLDIRAPDAGLVLARNVEPGQVVSAGSGALFRMAQGGMMEVQAKLADEDLVAVRVGAPATVVPVGTALQISGQVWQVSPTVDPTSRQGIARVSVPYQQVLRPGGFAQVSLVSGSADVPLLPQSAVLSDSKGNYVYVVGRDNKVERRDVKVGDVEDQGVTIVAGLTGQERVVASAGAFLNAGDKILPVRDAARP